MLPSSPRAILSVDEVLANKERLLGRDVRVRGKTTLSAGCHAEGLSPSPPSGSCGHRCSGVVALMGADRALPSSLQGSDVTRSDAIALRYFRCSGDETSICCPLRLGMEVVVTGVLTSTKGDVTASVDQEERRLDLALTRVAICSPRAAQVPR